MLDDSREELEVIKIPYHYSQISSVGVRLNSGDHPEA
jgi:hypothetical protein